MEASRTEVVVGFKKKKSVGPCASGEWACVILSSPGFLRHLFLLPWV